LFGGQAVPLDRFGLVFINAFTIIIGIASLLSG
jgi:hypothetical protein